ncbi:alpha/beta hydrolase [Halobacillus trueperi]|uniref:alpha/beta hydrolase n=1 Tax=Halobacillus trueperi TaxID=156205 RepID=UPI003734D049
MSNYLQEFVETQKQAISLVQKEQFKESQILLEEAKSKFPERLDRIGHWKAGIFMLEDKRAEAITELKEVLDRGLWWNPEILMNDEELQPLKESKEFNEIIKRCTEMYGKYKEEACATLQVEGNPQANTAIYSLHWKGSNAKDFASQWSEPEILSEYLMGFVQSSQLFSFDSYAWDEWDVVEKDVREKFLEFKERYNIDEKKFIIAGASQGGRAAVELLLKNSLPGLKGFLAFVPSFTDSDDIESILAEGVKENTRGCVITGDKDPFYHQTVKVVNGLNERGVPCKLIVNKGMGHVLPDDFAQQLRECVDFILNNKS